MSNEKAVLPELNLKRSSETKLQKSSRRVSKLPKCSPSKLNGSRPQTAEANQATLDFPTRMKLKEKISELQQLNNELKFKITTAEAKLKTKDTELIAAESLNKQIKQLLDKHINREQELNVQILNLERKVTKFSQQLGELEEDNKKFSNEKNEFQTLTRLNKELIESLAVKEAQILDLSGQIADVKQSFNAARIRNETLESQLEEVKKIEPMLDVRKNYINNLEEKVKHLENLCSDMNDENCKLKYGINRLESFRLHSFLAAMGRDTCLL
ncbi:coiled-coil domain-containing protein 102B-like [Bradysia coprophila]|uniref:coiled-coil domain-containing protein 102B-like n=1 Tax=Bradysia coprophila TaxID=38358 RepID=UPI00187DAFD4|nr:coiled-coil domain-containing protein 102B-like [Bradysia coprophila]